MLELIGVEGIPIEAGGPIGVEESNIEEFADPVEGLVHRKADPSFALGIVDQGVEDEFRHGEDDEPGDEPDPARVNQGVGEERIPPQAPGSTIWEKVSEVRVLIFGLGEEAALQCKVADRVHDEQCKKDDNRTPRIVCDLVDVKH